MFSLVVFLAISFFVPSGAQNTSVEITTDNVTLYLYTQQNQNHNDFQLIRTANLSDLPSSNFNPNRLNYFVFHGLYTNYRLSFYAKDPILSQRDVNVFLVDFSGPASIFEIHDETIVATGKIVADFIDLMKRTYNLVAENFVLIGFSMGAHVAGEVGKNLNGHIDTLVALDPANMTPPIVYVHNNSAHFVQSVHTSRVGILTPLGQASYFVNTVDQPGCNGDMNCGHMRAPSLFQESLTTGGFAAVKCDSYESYAAGSCNNNERSYMGGIDLDKRATGNYYLRTNAVPPYSLGDTSSSGSFSPELYAVYLALLMLSLIL